MASGRRQSLLAVLVLLLAAACVWRWTFGDVFVAPKLSYSYRPLPHSPIRTARFASDSAAEDSVEISGFSGFVVGLAFLPHTCYALLTAVNVVRGESFQFLSFELLSSVVSLGLTAWSLGSFLQRGRGLPAGPLGLLGLSEGLSYLAALGLLAATAASGIRAGASLPSLSVPNVSIPNVSLPTSLPKGVEIPNVKVPDVKLPDIKAKLPDVTLPKVPDIKVPDIKVPDVKLPDVKIPEVKVPDIKLPEKKEEKKEKKEVKAPAPTPPPKKAEAKSDVDFSSLFD